MAGTVLIYKIAAALAQQGKSLEEVDRISRAAANRLGTYAVGLEHCHVGRRMGRRVLLIAFRFQALPQRRCTCKPTKSSWFVCQYTLVTPAEAYDREWAFITSLELRRLP